MSMNSLTVRHKACAHYESLSTAALPLRHDSKHEPQGYCYDKCRGGKFFQFLKKEIVHDHNYYTRERARSEIFNYSELF